MLKRFAALTTSLVVGSMLIAASVAPGATEVGSNCVANQVAMGSQTSVPIASAPSNPLPLVVPEAGVVTRWMMNVGFMAPVPVRLKVLQATGTPNELTVVDESALETALAGTNVFPARIPVQPGARLGRSSPATGAPYCGGLPAANTSATVTGDRPVGSTTTYFVSTGSAIPVSAIIEPDVDGDGFGDETQDGCAKSPAIQDACPIVELGSVSMPEKSSFVLLVTTSLEVPVNVSATVRVPKQAEGKGRAAKQIALSGGTQTVAPGRIVRFRLRYPKALRAALTELGPKDSLTLKATASTTTVAGDIFTRAVKAKLRASG